MACAKLLKAETEGARERVPALEPRRVRPGHRELRAHAQLGARPPDLRRCWSRSRPSALTVFLYIVIPKGFFPVQDTGLIQGISEAPQSVSFAAMAERQQALAERHPEGSRCRQPVLLHRRRRHQHDAQQRPVPDQPQAARRAQVRHRHASCAGSRTPPATLTGISLYMQPVQDLTIEGTVSRDAIPVRPAGRRSRYSSRNGRRSSSTSSARCRSSAMSPPTSRRRASRSSSRSTATRPARFGITPATDRQRALRFLRPAHRLDHLHQVEPVPRDPGSRSGAAELAGVAERHLSALLGRQSTPVPLAVIAKMREETAPLQIAHLGQFPSAMISFNLAPGASLGEAVDAIKQAQAEIGLPLSVITSFQGAALAFQSSLSNELFLILAAIVTVYIVLGVLYESFIHPITILSTLPSAGVGALLALMVGRPGPHHHRDHRHHSADRHRQEERDHDDRLRARRRAQRGQAAARGDLPGLPAALPPDPDDDHGGGARRAAADARHRHRARNCAIRSASPSSAASWSARC